MSGDGRIPSSRPSQLQRPNRPPYLCSSDVLRGSGRLRAGSRPQLMATGDLRSTVTYEFPGAQEWGAARETPSPSKPEQYRLLQLEGVLTLLLSCGVLRPRTLHELCKHCVSERHGAHILINVSRGTEKLPSSGPSTLGPCQVSWGQLLPPYSGLPPGYVVWSLMSI